MPDPFQRSVVQVHVRRDEIRGARHNRPLGAHGEAVVLRGDLYLAGCQIADRVVSAPVPIQQLEGLRPKSQRDELVT